MMRFISTLLVNFSVATCLFAQLGTETISLNEFIGLVKSNHPIARQADLLNGKANAVSLKARGAFDPQLSANIDQKYFKDQNYFSFIEGNVSVPTQYGVEFSAGYDLNDGINLNPSDLLPASGLYQVGVKANILKGLLFDQRRASVKKADLFRDATELEQITMLNDLLAEAMKDYFKWSLQVQRLNAVANYVQMADSTYRGMSTSFLLGTSTAIDTIEAKIAVLERQQALQASQASLINNRMLMSNHLWSDKLEPLQVQLNVRPRRDEEKEIQRIVDSVMVSSFNIGGHPELTKIDVELGGLDIDRRLLRENLKPDLSVSYNPFLYRFSERGFNDYKWQLGFSFPLFLRSARADLQLNEIERTAIEIKRAELSNRISTQILTYRDQLDLTRAQLEIQTKVVDHQRVLIEMERRKLSLGESTLFLLNSREKKWIESVYKLIDINAKLQSLQIEFLQELGILHLVI